MRCPRQILNSQSKGYVPQYSIKSKVKDVTAASVLTFMRYFDEILNSENKKVMHDS